MKKFTIILLLFLTTFGLFSVDDKPTLAILKINAMDVDFTIADRVEQVLFAYLSLKEVCNIVEVEKSRLIAEDMHLLRENDVTREKIINAGRLLGATVVLTGTVSFISGYYTIDIAGMDITTGTTKITRSVSFKTEDDLLKTVEALAQFIIDHCMTGTDLDNSLMSKSKLSMINIGGIVFEGAGASLLIAGSALLIYDLTYYNSEIERLLNVDEPTKENYALYRKTYDTNIGLFTSGITMMIFGVGLMAGGIPMILYKDRDKEVRFNIEPSTDVALYFSYKF